MNDSPGPEDLPEHMKEALRNLEMPSDPVGDLAQATIAWREVYNSFKDREFTNAQALYLTAAFMNGSPGTAPRA